MQLISNLTLTIILCYLKLIVSVEAKCQEKISINATNKSSDFKLTYRQISRMQASLGEGPHWDIETQSLYFVDIDNAKLFRYDYQRNRMYYCQVQGEKFASFIIPIEGRNNKFAVGCGLRVVIVTWNGRRRKCFVDRTIFSVQPEFENRGNRINDGKCDPQGRLFTGTMGNITSLPARRTGELYRYDRGIVRRIKSNVGISNGLAWNERRQKFYYIDTLDFNIKEYHYNFRTGVPSRPRIVFKLQQDLFPDGMTIDTQGNIYVAIFNGHRIVKINPRTGTILAEVMLPCRKITSCAFGGPKLDILYVTSAADPNDPTSTCDLFEVTGLAAKGRPMTKMRI